jgi:hypothetical protein
LARKLGHLVERDGDEVKLIVDTLRNEVLIFSEYQLRLRISKNVRFLMHVFLTKIDLRAELMKKEPLQLRYIRDLFKDADNDGVGMISSKDALLISEVLFDF